MTKKHFIAVAKRIAEIDDIDIKIKLANWFANWFAIYNKQFDKNKFLIACGIEKDIKWYCINCDKLKEEYEASLCDKCFKDEF